MIEFARTRMGAMFLEGTLPRIARALERIATALEAQNAVNLPAPPKTEAPKEPE